MTPAQVTLKPSAKAGKGPKSWLVLKRYIAVHANLMAAVKAGEGRG